MLLFRHVTEVLAMVSVFPSINQVVYLSYCIHEVKFSNYTKELCRVIVENFPATCYQDCSQYEANRGTCFGHFFVSVVSCLKGESKKMAVLYL